jgi:hypothetical protein
VRAYNRSSYLKRKQAKADEESVKLFLQMQAAIGWLVKFAKQRKPKHNNKRG